MSVHIAPRNCRTRRRSAPTASRTRPWLQRGPCRGGPTGFRPRLETHGNQTGVPRTSYGVPAQYKGLEPEVARNGSVGIPWKVWVSLGLAFGWGLVPISVAPQLGVAGLLLLPV